MLLQNRKCQCESNFSKHQKMNLQNLTPLTDTHINVKSVLKCFQIALLSKTL